MQFDNQRAFPYPVLRPNNDDYMDGDFQIIQPEFEESEDGKNIVVSCEFALSVPEIKRLIRSGDAAYTLTMSCRDTYFRKSVRTAGTAIRVSLPAGILRGEVQVFPYVVATKPIKRFSSKLINTEFGKGPFSFDEGSVLAVDEPGAVYIDRDLFKPVSSVFELVKNDNLPIAEWQIYLSGPKVQIAVSSQMKEKIDVLRNNPRNRAIFINSLYFAAVVHCLNQLRQNETEYQGLRWADVFHQQCHNQNIDLKNDDAYLAAQHLLRHPLGILETYLSREVKE